MRVEQLEYVTAVARLGSFRRAAEELHISQPALSETVRKPRGELGVEILERRPGRDPDQPRPAATCSPTCSTRSRRSRGCACVAVCRGRAEVGTVRVGTVTAATAPLPDADDRRVRGAPPGTEVEVVGAQQDQIHEPLLQGSLDLGLVNYLEGEEVPRNSRRSSWSAAGRSCASAPTARWRRGPRSRRRAPPEPLIAMRPGYVMHRYLERLFGDAGPSFSFSADGAELGKLMVAEGLGAALLPDYSVAATRSRPAARSSTADRGRRHQGHPRRPAPPLELPGPGGERPPPALRRPRRPRLGHSGLARASGSRASEPVRRASEVQQPASQFPGPYRPLSSEAGVRADRAHRLLAFGGASRPRSPGPRRRRGARDRARLGRLGRRPGDAAGAARAAAAVPRHRGQRLRRDDRGGRCLRRHRRPAGPGAGRPGADRQPGGATGGGDGAGRYRDRAAGLDRRRPGAAAVASRLGGAGLRTRDERGVDGGALRPGAGDRRLRRRAAGTWR